LPLPTSIKNKVRGRKKNQKNEKKKHHFRKSLRKTNFSDFPIMMKLKKYIKNINKQRNVLKNKPKLSCGSF
jgi:hypothetical protein